MKFLGRFKHRKPKVYISFGIYVLLIALIIFESCLDSSASGARSNLFAQISAFFVNLFNGPQAVEVIKPNKVKLLSDTTVLGQDDLGVSNIVIGTTSRVILELNYPVKKNKDDSYVQTFDMSYTVGHQDHYDIKNISFQKGSTSNKFNFVFYVVALDKGDDLYQFNVKFAELDKVTYTYSFHIVDVATPTDFEAKLEKETLKIGETTRVLTKLNGDSRGNWFLNRYYDISTISRSSSDPSVATIDENGVVHALSNGTTTIHYGNKELSLTVTNQSINKPVTNSISLQKDPSSNENLHLLDYDYVFATKNYITNEKYDPNEYSVLVYSNFENTSLEDKSVSWSLDSDMKGKISPYEYDSQGYPIYHDDLGNECVRVSGYREEGSLTLTCTSNVDSSITASISLAIVEAHATAMEVKNIENNFEIMLGDQKIISAKFDPENTFDSAITVTCSDAEAVKISGSGTSSVTIKANKEGSYTLTVTSVSNTLLTETFNFKVVAKKVVNKENFTDFASFMRKFAGHMGLFLVTSIAGFVFFYTFIEDKEKKLLLATGLTLGVGLLVAGLSELIQLLVPTRSGLIRDVGIDFLGATIGVLLCVAVWFITKLIKSAKTKKEQS